MREHNDNNDDISESDIDLLDFDIEEQIGIFLQVGLGIASAVAIIAIAFAYYRAMYEDSRGLEYNGSRFYEKVYKPQ